jgi:hypothetical protein
VQLAAQFPTTASAAESTRGPEPNHRSPQLSATKESVSDGATCGSGTSNAMPASGCSLAAGVPFDKGSSYFSNIYYYQEGISSCLQNNMTECI